MQHVKYLILGGGPAGLTVAEKLKEKGETSFLVLEKEETAGGLCRSVMVDGSPFDIGGGHFLDVRRPAVNEFLFRFMPEKEWKLFKRDSRISFHGRLINHPFEANIWQMGLKDQLIYLNSIKKAGCNKKLEKPDIFVDWIKWKLGERVAEDYMLPYNRKMFADELNHLGTYWLEKLPAVSYKETIMSCLQHKAYGTQPGHASFYYPLQHGYGEVWLRIAKDLEPHILYHADAVMLDCNTKVVQTSDGSCYAADYIITSIPWASFKKIVGMPEDILKSIGQLKYSAVETRYVNKTLNTPAQWIYIPDPDIPYHRILVRHNFCTGAKGYWLETRAERTHLYAGSDSYRYLNEYAYPLNTVNKPDIMEKLLSFTASRQILGIGRWGEHEHYNSDRTVELAMNLVEKLA